MKIIALMFILMINHAFAQYPRKANQANIETDSLFESPLFSECVNILAAEGYKFSDINEYSLSLITEPVEIHKLPLLFKLALEVEGSFINLQGYILDDRDFEKMGLFPVPKEWEFAAYRSFNGSTWRTGFDVLVRLAEKIRSGVYGKVSWSVAETSLLDKKREELWGDNTEIMYK